MLHRGRLTGAESVVNNMKCEGKEMTVSLETLCSDLVTTKQAEQMAKKRRIDLENKIASMVATKAEGAEKAATESFRVTVTSKLSRTLDYPAYLAIEGKLPEGVRCVDLKPSLNIKKLRALEALDPDLPSHFVTSKPAKATVKVEAI